MPLIYKIILLSIEIPFFGKVGEREITIGAILFFVLFVIFALIISKMKKRKLRKIQLAVKPYSTILETDEDCVSKCYERLYRGDIVGAIYFLDKAIKIKPEKEERYIIRGNLKFRIGDFKGALLDFSRTISLNPQNASAHYQRGLAKQSLGLIAEAQKDFDTAKKFGYNIPVNQQNENAL